MSSILDLYRVQCTAGNAGTPGAPLLHLQLLVDAPTGKVSGQASVTQTITPPGGNIVIHNLTGQVLKLGFGQGPVTQVVALEGTYAQAGPPPTEYVIQLPFRAHFATDAHWNGRGGFEYGPHHIDGVPIKNDALTAGPVHTLYGVVIHEAVASGDRARMKDVAAQAERHIAATPEIQAALAALKAEITKAGG
jgi:Domain of unknown function (DUF1843)/Domain of unknown function (DUF1842)